MSTSRTQHVENQAYKIWEQAGRPEGMHREHWAQADHEIDADKNMTTSDARDGLAEDSKSKGQAQDTPGRAKSASSRQQTQPEQKIQSGSAELDKQDSGATRKL